MKNFPPLQSREMEVNLVSVFRLAGTLGASISVLSTQALNYDNDVDPRSVSRKSLHAFTLDDLADWSLLLAPRLSLRLALESAESNRTHIQSSPPQRRLWSDG